MVYVIVSLKKGLWFQMPWCWLGMMFSCQNNQLKFKIAADRKLRLVKKLTQSLWSISTKISGNFDVPHRPWYLGNPSFLWQGHQDVKKLLIFCLLLFGTQSLKIAFKTKTKDSLRKLWWTDQLTLSYIERLSTLIKIK